MLQSKLFTKTRREAPKDEVAKNAILLIRAGFIHKELAGVYSYLPLGLRVLNKINAIIREEMNAIGGQEIFLSTLQNPEPWKKSGRWDDAVVDNWFKTSLKDGGELGLSFTHEEPLAMVMKNFISSYRDLPILAYQLQTKFRNEVRAKSGMMRGREFLMKDLYSFHSDQAGLDAFYEEAKQAYMNIYDRVGIGNQTFVTFASGGTFAKYSHEFQTLCAAGEDTIYVSREQKIAINKEVYTDKILAELGLSKGKLQEERAVEVGNIFKLGTKYSLPLELLYSTEAGEKKPVVMGSYGLGPGRLMGTVVELLADDKGLVWPRTIAPFTTHLVPVGYETDTVKRRTDDLYRKLTQAGVEVLLDDRAVLPGEKFAEADLIGVPYRLVMSEKVAEGQVEVKERRSSRVEMIPEEDLLARLKN